MMLMPLFFFVLPLSPFWEKRIPLGMMPGIWSLIEARCFLVALKGLFAVLLSTVLNLLLFVRFSGY